MQNSNSEIQYSPIVIGIIYNQQDEVLLTQRTAGRHLAGYWEFPGGKVAAGETLEAALKRELREEVGIEVTACSILTTTYHRYDDRHLALHFFLVTGWQGNATACEGQPLLWCARKELRSDRFPNGNQEVIDKLLAL